MSDELFGLDEAQLARLRRLLEAFESGRLDNVFAPVPRLPINPLWTSIGKTTEVVSAASGSLPGSGTVDRWHLDPVGLSLTNTEISVEAYNPTASTIASGTWVLLYRDPLSGQWICEPYSSGGGSSLTVQDLAGSNIYTNISLIRLELPTGILLANPSAGEVNISLNDATVSDWGVMTTDDQQFAGIKTFTNFTYHVDGLSSGPAYFGGLDFPPVPGTSGMHTAFIDASQGGEADVTRARVMGFTMPGVGLNNQGCEIWLETDISAVRSSIYFLGNIAGGGGTSVNANRPKIFIATDATGTGGTYAEGQTDTFLGLTFTSGILTSTDTIDTVDGGTW